MIARERVDEDDELSHDRVKEVLGDFMARRHLAEQLLGDVQVGIAGPQTMSGGAIGLGIATLAHDDPPAHTMILLTDGNDTGSKVPPVEAARIAHDQGITIHTIAVGDPRTVGEGKIDQAT